MSSGPVSARSGDCGIDVLRGCGLHIDQNNALAVNLDEIVGDGVGGPKYGLTVFPEAGCDRIGVSTGCGIAFDGTGALIVSNGELAGCGLKTDGECGLAIDPDAIAGAGLVPAGVNCAIQVSTGCGIVFGPSNELEVDLRGFDGPGLSPWQNPATGCWGLQADQAGGGPQAGCGLIDNAGVWDVDPAQLAGEGLQPMVAGCGFDVDCNYIRTNCLGGFTGTKTVYVDDGFGGQVTEDWTFQDGVLMGVV